MAQPFDPGYTTEPFLTLCSDYPGETVYPRDQFRVEWGPIFHRGRHHDVHWPLGPGRLGMGCRHGQGQHGSEGEEQQVATGAHRGCAFE